MTGEDRLTGNDYSHRKAWVLERLALLSEIFTIDLGVTVHQPYIDSGEFRPKTSG